MRFELLYLFAYPFALLTVLCVRLIRPWLIIRLGILRSERIGHFSIHPEIYLSGLDCGIENPNKPFLDIWSLGRYTSNHQLAKMWRRSLRIWPYWIVWPLFRINASFAGHGIHCIPHADLNLDFRKACISQDVLARTDSHLYFTASEKENGFRCLNAMGIAQGTQYICFHGRDSRYLQETYPGPGNWSYHDFRDVDIHNYLPAVEELTRRGYVAVRMGSKVRDRLTSTNPNIVDYANSPHQSDFMDIFLSAHCEFFLSSGSGVMCVSMAFRRPQVIISEAPLCTSLDMDSSHLFIPKLYRKISSARDMTYSEIFATHAHKFDVTQDYSDAGIELVESSPHDILDLVIEAEERFRGAWTPKPEDDELQQRFWVIWPNDLHSGPIRSKIGASFLRNHPHLLDLLA